jgi:hypothetical protein
VRRSEHIKVPDIRFRGRIENENYLLITGGKEKRKRKQPRETGLSGNPVYLG